MIRAADRVNSLAATVLALDVGGTWTRAAALADDGTVLRRHAARTPADGTHAELSAALVAAAVAVRDALAPGQAATLRAIGIAITGPLDPRAGVLLGPPNLGPGYRDLPLAAPLRAAFGLPVFAERDTHVAALGEHAFGAARGARDFLYLTVSTGVGGAIFSAGRLLTGPHDAAGELGHMPVALDGPPCSCGLRGCLEALASGDGIAAAARATIASDTRAPSTARAVAAAALAGEPAAVAIMERARAAFAAAAVGFVNALDPGLIVVGGSVARGEGERLLGPARALIAAHAFTPAARATRVVAAALGDDPGLLGALPLTRLGTPSA